MAYCLNAGVSASPSATAFAAITCSSGPPWIPGKTCLSTSFPNASWQRINPPRGPRSVLCVVVVTICACGTGEGWIPAATSPAKCAMSTTRIPPTPSAMLRSAAKSMMRLHVHVLRLEERLRAVDRELLHLVDDLAAAVVALLGKPLGVLVRERAAHRLHHGHGGEVLTRDELQPVLLALHLAADERVDGRIGLAERRAAVDHGRAGPASILCTRRTCRPPSKAVSNHLWRISIPSSSLTKRAGSTSTLASLCRRASSAISGLHATAARTRG